MIVTPVIACALFMETDTDIPAPVATGLVPGQAAVADRKPFVAG